MTQYARGTKTGRTYTYAGCLIGWNGAEWIAHHPFGKPEIIARAKGLKPMRDILHAMKLKGVGPWSKLHAGLNGS